MRYTLILILTFTISNVLIAQSGQWRFLGGVKMSSKWQQQQYGIFAEDVHWQIEDTEPINLATYSLIYSKKIQQKWEWSVGLNYNLKGYKVTGTLHDFTVGSIPLKENEIRQYAGILAGVGYLLFEKKNWRIGTELFINPEIELQGYHDVKKLAVSSVSLINFEKAFNKHFSIVLNPFFETSLMRYNNPSSLFGKNRYNPFGYGLIFGFKYRK